MTTAAPAGPGEAGPAGFVGLDRRQLVTRAARRWAEELVDLSGRNNLLYHRDLRVGSLDVTNGDLDAMNRLLSGQRVRVSSLLPAVSGDAGDPNRRLRAIARTATANFEEKGLRTTHLAVGLARWSDPASAATPNAPILLCPLSILAAGGSKVGDHELVLDGDWVINPTLLFKLRHDFGVVVADLEPTTDPDEDGFDVGDVRDVLEEFAAKVGAGDRVPDLSIDPRGVIGNFSYMKQPMVDDLERSIEALVGHTLISALAGDGSAHAELHSRHGEIPLSAPDGIMPSTEFLVLDADSSQHQAINTALSGADLVVQGPPGTGKSQTIANLIACLVAQRKSVLFVAEKRAAIDAVTRRLVDIDLGSLVMDLHDGVSSRTRVAAELADALTAARNTPALDRSLADGQLVEQRRRLAEHSAAMNAPRDPWGVSVFELQAELLGVGTDHQFTSRLAPSGLQALTLERVQQLSEQLQEWINLGGPTVADPAANPWAAAAERVQRPDQAASLVTFIDHLIDEQLPATATLLRAACDAAGLREPHELDGWPAMFDLLDEVGRLAPAVHPHGLEVDLSGYVTALAPSTQTGVRRTVSSLFDSKFRAARSDARGWVADPSMPTDEVRRLFISCGELRDRWAAMSVDGGSPRIPPEAAAARASLVELVNALGSLGAWIDRADLVSLPFHEIDAVLRSLSEGRNGLFRLPRLFELRTSLVEVGLTPQLAEVAQRHLSAEEAARALQVGWLQAVLQWITANDPAVASVEGVELSRRAHDFRSADGSQISSGRERVRRAWAEWVVSARDRCPDQEKAVLAQAARRRGHLPLRELFVKAPDVMLALKPCWAMSPLVVSQLLPSIAGIFDVVVFDEASQVSPAEAIPALLRGKRAVVAGDSRQLPPTTFFTSVNELGDLDQPVADGAGGDGAVADGAAGDDAVSRSDQVDADNLTVDTESILDSLAALLPAPRGSRTLTWHYRSRDERLIAFSNAQPSLYRGSMTTFPGVVDECLRLITVDGSRPDPVEFADRADPSDPSGPVALVTPGEEVRRVVELIAEHARRRPEESLGVIALGIRHAERIEEALRDAGRADPVLEQFVQTSRSEPFFVKNLERVQGDERDAIILTIGAGRGPDGRVRYQFGPINQVGGERRLNVAISRAKRRMTVVSSLRAADLDPARLGSEGAQMLRRYLAYVESSGADLGAERVGPPALTSFEIDLVEHIRSAGIPAIAHHGVSGHRIDLALGHPTRAGEMVLAVEADGGSYAALPTTRDRDRLRQDQLERLGWAFVRVWSTEWFRHRDRELARIVAAWRSAVEAADRRAATGPSGPSGPTGPTGPTIQLPRDPTVVLPDDRPRSPARALPRPPFVPGTPIGDYTQAQLIDVIVWIESDTLLRTQDELLDAAIDELGFARRGSRIVAALDDAITAARGSVPRTF